MKDVPSINELTQAKVDVKSWVPPVVRSRLVEMANAEGRPVSQFTAGILSAAAFPALAPDTKSLDGPLAAGGPEL